MRRAPRSPTLLITYRVDFSASLPAGVDVGSLASFDELSGGGAVIEDSSFASSFANIGRWKSSASSIARNSFARVCSAQLQVGPLQNYLEGMAGIRNVSIVNNTFVTGTNPIVTWQASDVRATGNRVI